MQEEKQGARFYLVKDHLIFVAVDGWSKVKRAA